MSIDAKLHKEVTELVSQGAEISRKAASSERGLSESDIAQVATWVTRLGQLIRKLYGEDGHLFVSYKAACGTGSFYSLWSSHYTHFTQLVGIAQAIKHEIDNDLLLDFRAQLRGEVFADFLEMGEYLLNDGYKDAAAVIIGTVLEDRLRNLSVTHGLPLANDQGKPFTMDPLNSQLRKADIYNALTQKQITSWADLRNKAAHGKYDEYDKAQVQSMLTFVQGFVA